MLNANTFFSNKAGIPVGAFTQNQYGVYAGGPVYIPGIYNGKDKSFWFFSWEGFGLRQGQTYVTTVPTAAERAGDFSNLRESSGNVIPIYDPLTVCGKLGNPACAVGADGQPIYTRQQFSYNGVLNVIPPSRLNSAAIQLEKLWPAANTSGQAFTNVNDYTANASVGGNTAEVITRIDLPPENWFSGNVSSGV